MYQVPIPTRLLSKVEKPVKSEPPVRPSPVAAADPVEDVVEDADGGPVAMILLWVGMAVGATAVIAFIARWAR